MALLSRTAFSRRPGESRLITAGAFLVLVGVTLLQRVGYVVANADQIPISMATTYVGLLLWLASGRLRVDSTRVMLFGFAIGMMILTLFVNPHPFSVFSLCYLLALYAPYTLSLEISRDQYLRILRIFQNLILPPVIIGILQFLFNHTGREFPAFMDFLPDKFLLVGYNTHPVTEYGSTELRSNGELFLEPSFLSQFGGFGVLIELLWFRRYGRMALYMAGLLSSLSGTGVIMLGVFGLLALIRQRRFLLLGQLALIGFMVISFLHNSPIGGLLNRATEVESDDSSAFMRFVGPVLAMAFALGTDLTHWVSGLGPGTAKDVQILGIAFNPFVSAKLMIEYGVMGTIPFLIFATYCFFSRSFNLILAGASFFAYMLLSGSLQQPHTVFLFFIFSVIFHPERAIRPSLLMIGAASHSLTLSRPHGS